MNASFTKQYNELYNTAYNQNTNEDSLVQNQSRNMGRSVFFTNHWNKKCYIQNLNVIRRYNRNAERRVFVFHKLQKGIQ